MRPQTGSLVGALADLSPAARLLAVNQAGINLGFFMVLPYLAAYLTDGLGMAMGDRFESGRFPLVA